MTHIFRIFEKLRKVSNEKLILPILLHHHIINILLYGASIFLTFIHICVYVNICVYIYKYLHNRYFIHHIILESVLF